MKPQSWLFLLLCLAVHAPRGAAASPTDDLQAVEKAYREVDFERAQKLAEEALAKGGQPLFATARLHLLLGVANAALGRNAEAQAAFVRLLAIDPEQTLDRDLSPRMRAPYLEARGFWSSTPGRLGASVEVESDRLRVRLLDPAGMVRTIRVSARLQSSPAFRDADYQAERTRSGLELATSGEAIELALSLLDEHGNVVYQQGSREQPLRFPARSAITTKPEGRRSARQPNYWLGGLLSGVGAVAVGTGAVFHVQREREAKTWNGNDCERPGATRGEQCGRVETRLQRAQWLAISLYGAGGALLAGGVVALVVGKAKEPERAATFVCGPGSAALLSIDCGATF